MKRCIFSYLPLNVNTPKALHRINIPTLFSMSSISSSAPSHLIPLHVCQYLLFMKIHIDTEKCAGCGLCRNTAPTVFYIDGFQARLTSEGEGLLEGDELLKCRVREIVDSCPCEALHIEYGPDERETAEDRCPETIKSSNKTSGSSDR